MAGWRLYPADVGDDWFGFESVRRLDGLNCEIMMVPLPGHTFGHAGVAVHDGQKWLLLAGDAYFHHRETDGQQPYCTPGLRCYQTMMEKDRGARFANQDRLRQLRRDHGLQVEVFCSHDTTEFERLSRQAAGRPVVQGTAPVTSTRP